MSKLTNKRLLLLGGSYCKDAIKAFADEYKVKLIVAGNDPNALICDIADEYYNVNSTDYDTMTELIKSNAIDGVYLGSCEPVISAACKYVPECNLPCYCTSYQWETIQNKGKLKQLFIESGLPVVPRYNFTLEELESKSAEIEFPVITKPADSCGSKGFSICRNTDELKKGYIIAADNSVGGDVMIEKFVNNSGVVAFFSFTNGTPVFLGIEDKYPRVLTEGGSYIAGLLVFNSKYTKEFSERFVVKLSDMFRRLSLKEGTVWIEVFHDGDNYYFNEAGYRYGGSATIYPIDYLYGVNQVYADMYYALTGESQLKGFSPLNKTTSNKKYYCIYPLYSKSGIIKKYSGISKLESRSNVLKVIITKSVGSTVHPSGDFSQNCGLIHFTFDNLEELSDTIDFVHNTLYIYDELDNNLLIEKIDLNATEISIN